MMNDEIVLDERVDVVAVFETGCQPCRPIKFRRLNGKDVGITRIGLRHPVSRGVRTVHVFDVTDENADYRLELDSERLTWRLTREAEHHEHEL